MNLIIHSEEGKTIMQLLPHTQIEKPKTENIEIQSKNQKQNKKHLYIQKQNYNLKKNQKNLKKNQNQKTKTNYTDYRTSSISNDICITSLRIHILFCSGENKQTKSFILICINMTSLLHILLELTF